MERNKKPLAHTSRSSPKMKLHSREQKQSNEVARRRGKTLTFLHFGIASGKVVKTLRLGLSSVNRKGKIVILEVESYARKIYNRLDSRSLQLLRVTNTRALEDQWRRERSSRDDNLLAGPESPRSRMAGVQRLGGNRPDSDCAPVFDDDLVDLCVAKEVEVAVDGSSGVDVGVSTVASSSCVAVDPLEPLLGAMGGRKVLEIIDDGNSLRIGSAQEIILDGVSVVSKRHFDGAVKAVDITISSKITYISETVLSKEKEYLNYNSCRKV
jgi:hypothetical protein